MKKSVLVLLLAGLCFGVTTVQAKNWFNAPEAEVRQAAEQGDAEAQYLLGSNYYYGALDYRQAATWYLKAAEQGVVNAQYYLGHMYRDGEGVPQDYRKAAFWFRKAAEQGSVEAQGYLAAAYADGQGVPQNYQMAYVWYSVASANGSTFSVEFRDKAASKLTPAALADAQELAGEYFEKYQPKK